MYFSWIDDDYYQQKKQSASRHVTMKNFITYATLISCLLIKLNCAMVCTKFKMYNDDDNF